MTDNHYFNNQRQRTFSYNSIKRNRAIRSQKKFTEADQGLGSKDQKNHFKNQLKALIEAAPKDEKVILKCIDELKQKLQHMKTSPKRKATPDSNLILHRNNTQTKTKHRYKTNSNDCSRKFISKSLNIQPKNTIVPSLRDLQELRNQAKRQKQAAAQRRIPTEKQGFRYQRYKQELSPSSLAENQKRKLRHSSQVKIRSNTEEIIKLSKHPGRLYHPSNPRRVYTGPEQEKNPFSRNNSDKHAIRDNNLIKKPEEPQQVIDNNQKIGDLSTIIKQKQTLNFLGDSCVVIKRELSPSKPDPNSSKLLGFVDWKTNELKSVFSGSKQKKRKTGLDKLSKIFPKGFFVV